MSFSRRRGTPDRMVGGRDHPRTVPEQYRARDHPFEGDRCRSVLARPDGRYRQPQLLHLRQREKTTRTSSSCAETAHSRRHAVNVQAAWRHYASRVGNPHPTLSGIAYLRALLADQRPEEHFWNLAASGPALRTQLKVRGLAKSVHTSCCDMRLVISHLLAQSGVGSHEAVRRTRLRPPGSSRTFSVFSGRPVRL